MLRVSGSGSGRISIAGLVCLKSGQRTRLVYRMVVYHRRKGEKKGFAEADYAALVDGAHQQLGGNIVLVWDNVSTHVSVKMRELIANRPWLTVFQLPTYAPEINPVEGVWANLKGGLGNLAARSLDALAVLVGSRLKRVQYRATLIDGFVAETGLTLDLP
jgi:hypothetical protein